MTQTIGELRSLSDAVWQRTWGRLTGLTDDEYQWEPAPGCWSIRQGPDGRRHEEWAPIVYPEPLTTLAWRLWHLIDLYGEDRAPRWLGVPPQGDAVGLDAADPTRPPTAADALEQLERAHARWDAHLALVDDQRLGEVIGPVGGDHADDTRSSYVLHMLDEYIHHGAEIALLRDLYRWRQPISADPLTERAIRGDRTLVDDISGLEPATTSALMNTAATFGRWGLVDELLAAGAEPSPGGRTAAHAAAGAGNLELLQRLVEHGADLAAVDDDFHATPLAWARFLQRDRVVVWLEEQGAPE